MSERTSSSGHSITLDQLVALNDELAALARAGVPLDQGLIDLGGDLPGQLGKISAALGRRLQEGAALEDVLRDEADLPPAYRAVVTAGIRSGHLALALEGISGLIRNASEMRRLVILSLVYPLFVVLVAYVLFCLSLLLITPGVVHFLGDVQSKSFAVSFLRSLSETVVVWWPWPPLLLIVLLAGWWIRSRRAARLANAGRAPVKTSSRWPSVAQILHAGRIAAFADTLALLIENDVSLAEAVALAGDASGDRSLNASSRTLSDCIRKGEQLPNASAAAGLPPTIAWLLTAADNPRSLSASLRRFASSQQLRAQRMTRWMSLYFPLWITSLIGGSTVVCFGVMQIWPWARLMVALGAP